MNIYLWVASDRCWGEDSWVLQFAGGNNWNRLMRNILPYSCLPGATAPAHSGLWDPNTQSSARLGVHTGWRCPALVVSTQNGARQLGKGRGLWVLGAELVKVALEVVVAQLSGGSWCGGASTVTSTVHSPSTAFLPPWKACRVPGGTFRHRPCPFPALLLFPPPEIANTRRRRRRFWVPERREAGLA